MYDRNIKKIKQGEGWPHARNVTIPQEVFGETTPRTQPTPMIRFFQEKINPNFYHSSIIQAIEMALTAFQPEQNRCPNCGATHHLVYYGTYQRLWTEYHDHNCIHDQEGTIQRYKCLFCGKTHAILPSPLIPYARYSLDFMCRVLLTYSRRNQLGLTVQAVAEKYGIAISTLYEWKARVQKCITLSVGTMRSQMVSLAVFVRFIGLWRDLLRGLRLFFQTYGFSFMQRKPLIKTTGTKSPAQKKDPAAAASIKPEWITQALSVKLESTQKKGCDSSEPHERPETSARHGPISVFPDCSDHSGHTDGRVSGGLLPPNRGQPDPPT
jgi:transposase-like protein